MGRKEGGEGLGGGKVEEGGEVAALTDAGGRRAVCGLEAVHMHGCLSGGKKQPGPVEHTGGGPKGREGLKKEGAVNGVVRLCDVQEEGGTGGFGGI